MNNKPSSNKTSTNTKDKPLKKQTNKPNTSNREQKGSKNELSLQNKFDVLSDESEMEIVDSLDHGGGRVERRCWVNFQCRGVLLVWMIVGQGSIALAVGAGGGCWDIFSLVYLFSFLSPSLWETARYRLKYCLKGPLNPNNQSIS